MTSNKRPHMMRFFFLSLSLSLSLFHTNAQTLHVGNGYPYSNLYEAINDVEPGDQIIVHEGIYAGGLYFANVQGNTDAWITIRAAEGEVVIFEGGNNAWQFTDATYLHIIGFIFEHQAGNGVNFDDGGTYDTPAHHIIFESCIFRDMNANGNNDLLKLSGLDNFQINECSFLNGADGGSGIDMVGCHDGVIERCYFENMGSNAIQAKGGTSNVRIEANYFKNAGQRSLNLGGSTGLEFFRPIDAEYEAADLKVYSNIFIGSVAPVAYVGCINTEVVNNTIYLPENWVLRILQETVDTSRFFPCGNNSFINNLIVIDNNVNVVCNIGPNTAPETFTFSNNLWFHAEQPAWNGPVLPVSDNDNIIGENPLLGNPTNDDFTLLMESPAIGSALEVDQPVTDFYHRPYHNPRSIGAAEGAQISDVSSVVKENFFTVFPLPADSYLEVAFNSPLTHEVILSLIPISSEKIARRTTLEKGTSHYRLSTAGLAAGVYFIMVDHGNVVEQRPAIILH